MIEDLEKRQIIIRALQKLKPNAEFSCGDDYSELTWLDKTQDKPTEKEFNDAVEAEKKKYADNEYQRSRALEYPSIADQLDEIYHNGIDSWKAIIKQTKDKYPKG